MFASCGAALASGGLWCDVEDGAVKFHVGAGVTRGMGGPTFNFGGEIEMLGDKIAPDLRKTTFEDSNLAQYWLDDKELRLLVYHEREIGQTVASVTLTILTRASDEGVYDGTYALAVDDPRVNPGEYEPMEFDGKISCGVE